MKVRARETTIVTVDGAMFNVRQGEAFDSKDAIVKQHAWLFEEQVEQATKAPGERRG